MNQIKSTKKGFTIIEVVLVLAIAGLIFLMVFLALPALQRNQRDTQRKNDLSRVQSSLNQYQANNRGALPALADMGTFKTNYMERNGDAFKDPTGADYDFGTDLGTTGREGKIQYNLGSKCGAGESLESGAGDRSVALRIKLEGGGTYCLNN